MISEKIFELILRNGMTQKEFSEETMEFPSSTMQRTGKESMARISVGG